MTKIKYKIIISIILNIFISNFAFAEEVKNIREENKNTVSLGLGTIPLMHMPFIFGLEYARNISKNFSLGLGFKNSTFTINEISINSKYYLNFPNENSSFFIQAIEPTTVYLLDEQLILQLSKTNQSFLEFNNKLLHNHIRHLQKRINSLLGASAEERYLDFIKIYPDLTLRVPQILIASYLGMKIEMLRENVKC